MIISASCGLEPNRIIEYKPNVDEAVKLSGMDNIHNIVLQREEAFANIHHGDIVYQVLLLMT